MHVNRGKIILEKPMSFQVTQTVKMLCGKARNVTKRRKQQLETKEKCMISMAFVHSRQKKEQKSNIYIQLIHLTENKAD